MHFVASGNLFIDLFKKHQKLLKKTLQTCIVKVFS